jgi:hypothetical protein
LDTIVNGEVPIYVPLLGKSGDDVTGIDTEITPLFINEGRSNAGVQISNRTRTSRPSSGHPGVVVVAFCDGGARILKDDMDRTLFVRLCRPGSGVIINPKDID